MKADPLCSYHQNKNGICIDRCLGSDGILELPQEIDGQPVENLLPTFFQKGWMKMIARAIWKNDRIYSEEGNSRIRINIRT